MPAPACPSTGSVARRATASTATASARRRAPPASDALSRGAGGIARRHLPRGRWEVLDLFARVLLAVVFLAAVAGKVRTRQGFAEFRDSIAAITPWLPAKPLAVTVLAGEAVAVVLLAIPGTGLGYALAVALLAM